MIHTDEERRCAWQEIRTSCWSCFGCLSPSPDMNRQFTTITGNNTTTKKYIPNYAIAIHNLLKKKKKRNWNFLRFSWEFLHKVGVLQSNYTKKPHLEKNNIKIKNVKLSETEKVPHVKITFKIIVLNVLGNKLRKIS